MSVSCVPLSRRRSTRGAARGGARALHGGGDESQPFERAEVRVLPVLIARGRQALRGERRERRAPTGGEGRWGRERTRGKHVLLGDPGGEGRAHVFPQAASALTQS